jgi:hypothetical protein
MTSSAITAWCLLVGKNKKFIFHNVDDELLGVGLSAVLTMMVLCVRVVEQ